MIDYDPDMARQLIKDAGIGNGTKMAIDAIIMIAPYLKPTLEASLGMCEEIGVATAPTTAGFELLGDLGRLLNSAGLVLASADTDDRVALARVTLLRCAEAIWFAAWRRIAHEHATVELFQASPVAALSVLRGLLEPAELPRIEGPAG